MDSSFDRTLCRRWLFWINISSNIENMQVAGHQIVLYRNSISLGRDLTKCFMSNSQPIRVEAAAVFLPVNQEAEFEIQMPKGLHPQTVSLLTGTSSHLQVPSTQQKVHVYSMSIWISFSSPSLFPHPLAFCWPPLSFSLLLFVVLIFSILLFASRITYEDYKRKNL